MTNIEMTPEIIPATAEHFRAFYGKGPDRSVRALVAVMGDDVLGVVGLYRSDARMVLFSDLKPDARVYRKMIVRGALRMLEVMKTLRVPVHAVADCSIPGSVRMLERLGFIKAPDTEVYVWAQPH